MQRRRSLQSLVSRCSPATRHSPDNRQTQKPQSSRSPVSRHSPDNRQTRKTLKFSGPPVSRHSPDNHQTRKTPKFSVHLSDDILLTIDRHGNPKVLGPPVSRHSPDNRQTQKPRSSRGPEKNDEAGISGQAAESRYSHNWDSE
ncbi:hypothetical protein BaRGS_00040057 [Batillaria attramentaria]|uniref:Uncharacterized protein n=1 Tax=Batillaria attramentaria TaxID=370345 RepID=A0ABD0J1Y1_9CAEN